MAYTALLAGDDFLKGSEPKHPQQGRVGVAEMVSVAAASGVYGSLSFLERHGKLGLPLLAGVVAGYKHDTPGHEPKQQTPLALHGFKALLCHLQDGDRVGEVRVGTGHPHPPHPPATRGTSQGPAGSKKGAPQ